MPCIIHFNVLTFVSPTSGYNIIPKLKFKKLKNKKMKTIKNITAKALKVTALVALTLGSFTIKANNGKDLLNETEKTIKQNVNFPKLNLSNQADQKVEIVFTTSENGKVDFVLAKTKNEVLKKELEKQFSTLTLNKLAANTAYSIVFNFKTI